MPKKVRRLAMRCVLSAKLLEGRLVIMADLDLDEPKTRLLHQRLEELDVTNAVFVSGGETHEAPDFFRSSKNIPWVELESGLRANVLGLLKREKVVLTLSAVEHLQERLLMD